MASAIRFLVDESTGLAIAEFLRSSGFDVVYAGWVIPQADDSAILEFARREKRVVITNDKDFCELIFRSGKAHHGVLLLRLRSETPENWIAVVKAVIEKHISRLPQNFVIATENKLRIRPAGQNPGGKSGEHPIAG